MGSSKWNTIFPLRSTDAEHYAWRTNDFCGKTDLERKCEAGAKDEPKQRKRPIEAAFKEIARRLEIAPAQGGFGTAGESRSRTG